MAHLEFNKDTFVPYEKPVELTGCEYLLETLWDGKRKRVLRRTCGSWFKITVFYIIYYAGLCAFWAACMKGLFYTLNDQHPKYMLADSLIGDNPGLGFRPLSETVDVDGGLIWFNSKQPKQWQAWVDRTDEFLESYNVVNAQENHVECGYDRPPADGQVCEVNVKKWAPCNSANGFGYNRSSPCIFLKLNKIYNWQPVYYNDVNDLPEAMPDDLKEHIRTTDNRTLNTVWLSCKGENPHDREHLGPVQYYPQRGFPGYYYPYLHVPGYLSPLVAVRFERPKTGVMINIECRAWAHNVIYSHSKGVRQGSVHFEILVD